jgi:hypothetical protein
MGAAGDGFVGGQWVLITVMLPDAIQTISPSAQTPTGCHTVLISRKAAIQ